MDSYGHIQKILDENARLKDPVGYAIKASEKTVLRRLSDVTKGNQRVGLAQRVVLIFRIVGEECSKRLDYDQLKFGLEREIFDTAINLAVEHASPKEHAEIREAWKIFTDGWSRERNSDVPVTIAKKLREERNRLLRWFSDGKGSNPPDMAEVWARLTEERKGPTEDAVPLQTTLQSSCKKKPYPNRGKFLKAARRETGHKQTDFSFSERSVQSIEGGEEVTEDRLRAYLKQLNEWRESDKLAPISESDIPVD